MILEETHFISGFKSCKKTKLLEDTPVRFLSTRFIVVEMSGGYESRKCENIKLYNTLHILLIAYVKAQNA